MPLTDSQVIDEIGRFGDHAHDPETRAAWSTIDTYYRGDNEIELPEAVEGETGDYESLRRLFVHVNFTKTIVNASVTMALGEGIPVYGPDGLRDKNLERIYATTDVRRLLRYASKYGAGWLHINTGNRTKPYRVYKPHVARRLMETEDPEQEAAVLVIQRYQRFQNGIGRAAPENGKIGTPDPKDDTMPPEIIVGTSTLETYTVARYYEWDDDRVYVTRRDFVKEAGVWRRRLIGGRDEAVFDYMPWVFVPNRVEDTIPEQSDVIDGLEIIKQHDALLVKYLKGLEDEAWRLVFLASVGDEVAKRIKAAGGLNFWHAKNKAGEPPPELQSVAPADLRQFLEGHKYLVNSLATATRTSVLELNERPVDDIPAQTLRVLYGPQMERVGEMCEHVNPALGATLRQITGLQVEVRMWPRLPISEDKVHQNLKGLVDSKIYSGVQMLVDIGHTEADAKRIYAQALEEYRQRLVMEAEAEMMVEQIRVQAQARRQASSE